MLEKRLVLISTCWHTGIERLYAAVRTAYAEYAPGYQAIFCPQGELFAIDACRRQVSAYLADAAQAGREVAQTGRIADDTAARLAAHPLGCHVRAHHTPALEHHRRINSGGGAFPHPFSLTKSPFGPFRQAAFQNCKIEFCSIILQFCRCGG